jgi:hypothetical protein
MSTLIACHLAVILLLLILEISASTTSPAAAVSAASSEFDYEDALHKSLLFLEAQRSGKLDLSHGQRVPWRGDSALQDGISQGVGENDRSTRP